MKYHIILTDSHVERIEREKAGQAVPRSDLTLLAQNLNASFRKQKSCSIAAKDRIRAKFAGTPQNWAYARWLSSQLGAEDVVFCPGEEIGIPLASICSWQQQRPKLVVWFHRITGLRTRIALKLFSIANAIDLAVVSSLANQQFLHEYLNLPLKQILFWWHPIDSQFFTSRLVAACEITERSRGIQERGSGARFPRLPQVSLADTGTSKRRASQTADSPSSARIKFALKPTQTKPIIASMGLEYRDYKLLAAATEKLDVDVRVAGFSQFQSRIATSFPQVLPQNMSNQWYRWSELVNLYHHADIVVVPLKENDTAAGVTVLLEAMSCKKPIICIRTNGLREYLSDEEAVLTVEPKNVAGLQQAIIKLLNNSHQRKTMGQKAFKLVSKRHNLERQVRVLARFIRTLESSK